MANAFISMTIIGPSQEEKISGKKFLLSRPSQVIIMMPGGGSCEAVRWERECLRNRA